MQGAKLSDCFRTRTLKVVSLLSCGEPSGSGRVGGTNLEFKFSANVSFLGAHLGLSGFRI